MRLVHDVVGSVAPDAPEAWVLHGILGSGRNWRGFARQLSRELPGWRFVLPDLRGHGESTPASPPHTVAQCARDVLDTMAARKARPRAILGHSFGGKVALAYLEHAPDTLRTAWVLDAVPGPAERGGAGDDDVVAVIEAISAVPLPVPSFDALVERLTGQGFSTGLARWMTTNLARTDDGFVWQLELPVVRELLADYAKQDLWPVAEAPPCELHLVRAERSGRWSAEDQARWSALDERPRAHAHLLPDAGHWVHVDAPEVLGAWIVADLKALA